MTAALPVHPYVIVRCQRCGNNTRGHREAGTEYCTSCGGVLPNTPRAAESAHGGITDAGANGMPTPGSFGGLENPEEVIAKPANKCGICGVGFRSGEIPYRGLVSDEPFHAECYLQHYAAIEYEPEELIQGRHREP